MANSYCNFRKKLRMCTGIAKTGGVVAAASLAVAPKVAGEPVRWQFNDHVPPFTTKGYDVDNDGNLDVFFDTAGGVYMEAYKWENNTQVILGTVLNSTLNTNGEVKPHSFGDMVDQFAGDVIEAIQGTLLPHFQDPVPARYAGFTFTGGDGMIHLGWAEVRVTVDDPYDPVNGYGIDVLATGYDTDYSLLVYAGQPLVPIPTEKDTWGKIKALYE